MHNKRIVITVGGTGGHVFPAIALGHQLQKHAIDLLYVGGKLAQNPYFDKDLFAYQEISCATFKKKSALLTATYQILKGIKQGYKILKDYQPDLVVGFGSYYTLPLLIAAKLRGIPFILHEANSIPGKVNRLLSPYASSVGIHFPGSASLLKGNLREVGIPLRPGYSKGFIHSFEARRYFALDAERLTVLIFGGSQGAVKLNQLVFKAFIDHAETFKDRIQLIHFTGDVSSAEHFQREYEKVGIRSCVKPFESRMDLAWQAADICMTRAGAGTIAEQMEFEVPGILIPYPFATDNHQDKNADFFCATVGGAIKYSEADLTPALIAQEMASFDEAKRQKMRAAIQNYKNTYRLKDFCTHIIEEITKLQFGAKFALLPPDSHSSQVTYFQSSMSTCEEDEPTAKSSNLASKANFAILSKEELKP